MSRKPSAILVGATRRQLRQFGTAIERAGYRVAVVDSLDDVPNLQETALATLLVYNETIDPTTNTTLYQSFNAQPKVIILQHDDRARLESGFAHYSLLDAEGVQEYLQYYMSSDDQETGSPDSQVVPTPVMLPDNEQHEDENTPTPIFTELTETDDTSDIDDDTPVPTSDARESTDDDTPTSAMPADTKGEDTTESPVPTVSMEEEPTEDEPYLPTSDARESTDDDTPTSAMPADTRGEEDTSDSPVTEESTGDNSSLPTSDARESTDDDTPTFTAMPADTTVEEDTTESPVPTVSMEEEPTEDESSLPTSDAVESTEDDTPTFTAMPADTRGEEDTTESPVPTVSMEEEPTEDESSLPTSDARESTDDDTPTSAMPVDTTVEEDTTESPVPTEEEPTGDDSPSSVMGAGAWGVGTPVPQKDKFSSSVMGAGEGAGGAGEESTPAPQEDDTPPPAMAAGRENAWGTAQDTQQDTQEDDLAAPEEPRKRFGLGILVILLILIIAGGIGYQRLFAGGATQQQTPPPTEQREANMIPTAQSASGSNNNGNDGATAANSPKNSKSDLQAKIIGIFPEKPKVGDVVNVQVEISNTGSQSITDPFWVDLYVSPSEVPAANIAWNDISPYGAAWLVEQLEAQETLVLESLGADASRSNLLRFPAAEIHILQVLVDSYGLTGTGAIIEQNEDNNLSETREIDIAPSDT